MVQSRQLFLESVPKGAKVAEVGVWMGNFSQRILSTTQPAELHLVDPWRFDPTLPGRLYGGKYAHSQADMDGIQRSVVERFMGSPEVVVHRLSSLEAASHFPDGYFDWVYIDGDHSSQSVLNDLRSWSSKVKIGGLLTGDDYNWKDEQNSFSVMRAVTHFAEESGKPLFSMIDGQFIFRI